VEKGERERGKERRHGRGGKRTLVGPHEHFYRAMHFSAKRGIAIACRLSVRLSVCDVGEL